MRILRGTFRVSNWAKEKPIPIEEVEKCRNLSFTRFKKQVAMSYGFDFSGKRMRQWQIAMKSS